MATKRMGFAALVLAAVSVAGCAGTRSAGPTAEQRLTATEHRIAEMGDLYKIARDRINQIEQRYAAEVLSLKERILLLEARPAVAIPTPVGEKQPEETRKPDPPPTPEQPPTPVSEDPQAAAFAAAAVGKLKEGAEVKDVALEVFPKSREALPHLFRALGESRAAKEHELTEKLERLLATLPPADVKPHVEIALAKPELRSSAVAVIGGSGDGALGVLLEPLLAEEKGDDRFHLADALVRCKNKKGVPVLIETLKAEGYDRIIAYDILKRVTGESFGYRPGDSVADNETAVAEWEKWWENFGKDFEIH